MIYLEGASLHVTTAAEIAELGCQSRTSKPVERMFVELSLQFLENNAKQD